MLYWANKGMRCNSSNALYFSFHDQIVKTDWYGRELRWVQVDVHGGDICYWNGKVYTGVWLKPTNKGEQWRGAIGVYDAETLKPLKLHKLDWHWGTDGAVRFAFCYTPNWMHSRQQPVLHLQGVVKFAELKDGKFTYISHYGVFDKEFKR